jgi:hypothetical protein
MTKVVWEDSDLDEKVSELMRACAATGESTAVAANTVFRKLKAPDVVLGITRVRASLQRLVDRHSARKTEGSAPKYYLRRD